MPNTEDYAGWMGHDVVDQAGEKIGKVSAIFLDDRTGEPEWVTISTGLIAKRSSFVPLQGAGTRGDEIVVAYDKAKVSGAPQVDDDGDGHISPAEEEELYHYYGRGTVTQTAAAQPAPARTGQAQPAPAASRTSGDDAMTRSEEELRVGVAEREVGRARLRKYVVTEQVTETVPVAHERAVVEREAITDANRDKAMTGQDIKEAEYEVTLHDEVPVVEKTVVPVERVRLATETVTTEETVSADLRKEQIEEVEVDTDGRTRR